MGESLHLEPIESLGQQYPRISATEFASKANHQLHPPLPTAGSALTSKRPAVCNTIEQVSYQQKCVSNSVDLSCLRM